MGSFVKIHVKPNQKCKFRILHSGVEAVCVFALKNAICFNIVAFIVAPIISTPLYGSNRGKMDGADEDWRALLELDEMADEEDQDWATLIAVLMFFTESMNDLVAP